MPFLRLFCLAVALFFGTALFAFLPLHIKLSARAVTSVNLFSVGLLVGAALTIVIPEGVAAVFEASEHGGEEGEGDGRHHGNAGWIGAALLAGFILMYLIDSLHGHDSYPAPPHTHSASSSPSLRSRRPGYRPTPSHLAELEPLSRGRERDSNEYTRSSSRETSVERDSDPAGWDEEAGAMRGGRRAGDDDDELITADASSVSTVIGLVAHSLADGISLGASSLATAASASAATATAQADQSQGAGRSLQLIVFLAIILHKAPTAFALSSLLSSSPASSPAFVRRALALFALTAPVGAVITYLALSALGRSEEGPGMEWYTGLALVFSGGTFLFVATHAVREQEKRREEKEEQAGEGEQVKIWEKARLALVVAGMCTPGVLSRLVGHGH
ncbi:hypothetical protein JCM10213_005718 [Rhodosporidiobolus nylandii]